MSDQLIERIVRHEWDQFQRTNNEGGRAACQGNWPVFRQMRTSQFMTWTDPLLDSYLADLVEAERAGRNLVTEKYGRMMESTAPQDFHDNIEPYIPRLSDERIATQEHVIATQVAWAEDFRARYPKLGRAMRVLRTAEDTARNPRRSKHICAGSSAPTRNARWPCTGVSSTICSGRVGT